MILLLGATGYVGGAFADALTERELPFQTISRSEVDYTDRDALIQLLADSKATFLINSAGYTGKPNVDACELHRAECLAGNAVLPGVISEACAERSVPWGHVSSGCIYTGRHESGRGFVEDDPPNFCFRTDNCSFYSGCKAIGEECLENDDNAFVWRLRIPFDHIDSPRNYLSKLMNYRQLLEAENSISHLHEFVNACIDCWAKRVPFGVYNVTNTGSVTTQQVCSLIQKHLEPEREFSFFESEEAFMKIAAKTPRSNCVMENSKLLSAGVEMRDVEDAIVQSLTDWKRA
ncbi:MAG: sugar nucleotide-binding protein [Planctomycetota bacterium]